MSTTREFPEAERRPPRSTRERRGDLVNQAYGMLRDLILDGHFLPGERLPQQQLTEQLSIGRTPLREALRLLEADGLLVSEANRGMTVARPEVGDTEQLYAIRFLLEPAMVAGLVDVFTHSELDEMERHLDQMEAHVDHRSKFQRAHLDFHLVAIKHYGKELSRLILELYRRVVWHQRTYLSRPRAGDFVALDRMLLDALRAQRTTDVRTVLQFHLLDVAIGLALDIDPEHRFGPLLTAARGTGLTIATVNGTIAERPAVIGGASCWSTPIHTSNLAYDPMSELRTG